MVNFNKLIRENVMSAKIGCAGLGLVAMSSAFGTTDNCDGVSVAATKERRQEYAQLVVSAISSKVKPAEVKFHGIMESGPWSAAYVSTPVADDGVLFFQRIGDERRFREAWGGWADPSERPELIAWAIALGAPHDLAKCFADTVTSGR